MTTQRFAILSVGRSGTNYFVQKIGFLPGVLFGWEPFNQRLDDWFDSTDLFNALPQDVRSIIHDKNMRDRGHEEFYKAVFSPESKISLPGVSALGFKLFPSHSPNLFWKVAADRGMKVIILERKNCFDTFASLLMAVTGNDFTMTEFNKKGLLTFDPIAFDSFVQLTDCIYEGLKINLKLNKTEFIHLYYEDFTTSEDAFVRTCEFIGVPYEKYDFRSQKTGHNTIPRPIR